MHQEMFKIDLSPIEGKLSHAAFELFRKWTSQLQGKPDIVIKDERVLVADLRSCFESAIRNLVGKESLEAKPESWELGHVAGFIQGKLETRWYQAYVVRNCDEYRAFAALKSLEAYLQFDQLSRIRVEKLFTQFLNEDSNLEEIQEETILKEIDILSGGKHVVTPTEESGKVLVLVKNLIIEQIFKISEMQDRSVDLDLIGVFTWEEIAEVIAVNVRR